MALVGLIENRRQPEGWPNSLRVPEARWNVDRADKGQGYDRTHARDGHQPLTDFIVAREQENLAMQLGKLFTQDPARGEQRLHNIGYLRHALDEVVDPLLETDNANDSDFQSKIAQQTTDIVLDRKSLFLEYLSSGEEHPSFLACKVVGEAVTIGFRFADGFVMQFGYDGNRTLRAEPHDCTLTDRRSNTLRSFHHLVPATRKDRVIWRGPGVEK